MNTCAPPIQGQRHQNISLTLYNPSKLFAKAKTSHHSIYKQEKSIMEGGGAMSNSIFKYDAIINHKGKETRMLIGWFSYSK